MGSVATTYIPSFIDTGSGFQKSIRGKRRHADMLEAAYAYFKKAG
jgi:hypothetical protein